MAAGLETDGEGIIATQAKAISQTSEKIFPGRMGLPENIFFIVHLRESFGGAQWRKIVSDKRACKEAFQNLGVAQAKRCKRRNVDGRFDIIASRWNTCRGFIV